MKEWLRAQNPQDVAAFYDAKYRKDGYGAFKAGHGPRQKILDLLEHFAGTLDEKKNFLDAGCGNGEFLDFIARQRKLHVFGIDITPTAVHLASTLLSERGTVCEFDIAGAALSYPQHFNYITCLGAIEHTMDPRISFESLYKMLRVSGVLLITVPIEFDGCLTHIQAENNQDTNERFATIDEWRAIFGNQEIGFEILGEGESKDLALIFQKGETE